MNAHLQTQDEGRVRKPSKIEKLMVRHMNTAWAAPMFAVTVEVDMTSAMARRSDGVTLTDVMLADCAAVLARHPRINAHWRDDCVVEYDSVNIGLAVASERGLTVPVLHGADSLTLTDMAARRKDLVGKVREGRIGIAEVSGGTFTLSNLGMFGVTRFNAIINPPQVAILAVGGTVQRQIWNDGDPVWRPIAELTLTSDHRAVDGAGAASFLSDLKRQLEAG